MEQRIKELEQEIECLKKQMEVCAYGHEDLMELEALEEELGELEMEEE